MDFPTSYGPRPPWHDIQAEVRGPAVHDLEHTFRERWYGSSVLDVPSPFRQLYDRAYHAGAMTGTPAARAAARDDPTPRGTHAVQVLRTYPARLRRYPFAPLGERSIAHAVPPGVRSGPAARLPRGPVPLVRRRRRRHRRGAAREPASCTSSSWCRGSPTSDSGRDDGARAARPPGRAAAVRRGRRGPLRRLRPGEPRGHAGLRARQGRRRRRRVGDDRLGQPEPPVVDARQRAVHRRARRRARHARARSTRPASATVRGSSPATCGCGCGASTSTGTPTRSTTCSTRRPSAAFAAVRPPRSRSWYAGGQVGPRPPGRVRPHRPTEVGRADPAVGEALLPDRLRPRRSPVAGSPPPPRVTSATSRLPPTTSLRQGRPPSAAVSMTCRTRAANAHPQAGPGGQARPDGARCRD